MSLDTLDTIDALSDDKGSESVSLAIIDGWDWSDEAKHLFAHQSKLNAYFDFVQSGEIFDSRPSARGKSLRIDIVAKYPLPEKATKLLEIASQVAGQLDI